MRIPETVLIESLGNRVGGIARPNGFPAIFVRNALPGELVKVRVSKEKKNFIEADLISIEKESPYRVEPFCKYYGKCGGCSLQHLEYNQQLHWKRIWIEKAVRNLSVPEVDTVIPSPASQYRRAGFLAELGQKRLAAGKQDNPATLQPLYLRRPPITKPKRIVTL